MPFAQVQPGITILASHFHYGCMSVKIRELLGGMTTTTSSRMVVAFHEWLRRFFMNKMSFFHLFEMVMILDFHNREIFNKDSNRGWIIHLEEKMISISVIELTIRVKITKSLR